MKRLLFKTSLFAACALLFAGFSFGQAPQKDAADLRRNLQTKLDEWHRAGKFPGAVLGVCPADGRCFALATGFSDLEARTPMKPSDVMAAGSVGKTFAAAVALQLVKEGKIQLDSPI